MAVGGNDPRDPLGRLLDQLLGGEIRVHELLEPLEGALGRE